MVEELERRIKAKRYARARSLSLAELLTTLYHRIKHYQYVVMRWGPIINPEAVWLYGPISNLSQASEFANFHPRKLGAENLTYVRACACVRECECTTSH